MKTIGYVLTEFPVFSETFVGTEMRSMEQHGHTIVPLVFESNENNGQADDAALVKQVKRIRDVSRWQAGLRLVTNPAQVSAALRFARQQRGIPAKSLFAQGLKLAFLAKQQRCEHLHAHFALNSAATAIVAGKLLNIPVSFVGHGYDVYATPNDLDLKLSQSQFAVAVCQQMATDFQALAPNPSVEVIECGIDLNQYRFNPMTTTNGRLLFIGRLTEKKGLLTLLDALAQIDEIRRPCLDIVGEGPQQAELLAKVVELSLQSHVSFLGSKPSYWIRACAANYIALVAPFCEATNGDRDTGPLVLKEAMALGLPVISTQFMGCVEIVSPGTGWLVPPQHATSLASTIIRVMLLSDDARQTVMKRARRRIEETFCTLKTTQRLSDAIEVL